MDIPVADLRERSDTGQYIGPPVDFPVSYLKIGGAVFAKGSSLASAATVTLAGTDGIFVDITGTATISSFDVAGSPIGRLVRFTGILTLAYNATSLILPGGGNIITAAGDIGEFWNIGGSNWVCVRYLKADGTPLSGGNILSVALITTAHNFNPTGYGQYVNRILVTCASGSPKITGLVGGSTDREITIVNSISSAVDLLLSAEDAGSTSLNRFHGHDWNGGYIAPGQAISFRYNGTTQRWTVVELPLVDIVGSYGRSIITPGGFIFTNDGGISIFSYTWENGIALSAPLAIGSLFVVNFDGTINAPLQSAPITCGIFTNNKDNYGLATAILNRLSSDASRNVTGFGRPSSAFTAEITDVNVGSNDIVYKHQSTASTDYNRLLCTTGADITLSANQMIRRIYDPVTQRWRVSKMN